MIIQNDMRGPMEWEDDAETMARDFNPEDRYIDALEDHEQTFPELVKMSGGYPVKINGEPLALEEITGCIASAN